MAIERRDPVPAGRYYIIVMRDEASVWRAWLAAHKDEVRVRLTSAEGDAADYFVFDVLSPVPWVGLGYPTIVEAGALPHASETGTGPELGETNPVVLFFDQVKTLLWLGGAIYLGVALLNRRR